MELVSGSSLIVQGAFIQFASQVAQSSHHSFRATTLKYTQREPLTSRQKGGGQVNYFQIYFVLKQKNNFIECALSILAQQKRKTI